MLSMQIIYISHLSWEYKFERFLLFWDFLPQNIFFILVKFS